MEFNTSYVWHLHVCEHLLHNLLRLGIAMEFLNVHILRRRVRPYRMFIKNPAIGDDIGIILKARNSWPLFGSSPGEVRCVILVPSFLLEYGVSAE